MKLDEESFKEERRSEEAPPKAGWATYKLTGVIRIAIIIIYI